MALINGVVSSGGINNPLLTNGYRLDKSGNLIEDSLYCITDFMPINNAKSIVFDLGTTGSDGEYCLIEYDVNKTYIDYWNPTTRNRRYVALVGGINTKYIRATLLISNLSDCFVGDDTNFKILGDWRL